MLKDFICPEKKVFVPVFQFFEFCASVGSNVAFFFFFFFLFLFLFVIYSASPFCGALGMLYFVIMVFPLCLLICCFSFGIIVPIPVILKIEYPLKPTLGGVCSLANHSVAYEETQSNRVSEFRDFVCSLFPKTILFTFISLTFLCILSKYFLCRYPLSDRIYVPFSFDDFYLSKQ